MQLRYDVFSIDEPENNIVHVCKEIIFDRGFFTYVLRWLARMIIESTVQHFVVQLHLLETRCLAVNGKSLPQDLLDAINCLLAASLDNRYVVFADDGFALAFHIAGLLRISRESSLYFYIV